MKRFDPEIYPARGRTPHRLIRIRPYRLVTGTGHFVLIASSKVGTGRKKG